MVKRHNVAEQIIKFLLTNLSEQFTIREISKQISLDYKSVNLTVKDLIVKKIINAKKIGQTILCTLNQQGFGGLIFNAELIRKKELLKNKNLSSLYSYFKDIKSSFFILLIFGSYASGKQRKKSDIDLMVIVDDKKIKKQIEEKVSLIPLDIHLLSFSSDEFVSMLKTTEFNVGKEAFNNRILLFGIENYYGLIKNV